MTGGGLVIGIDIGTSSVKALLMNARGEVLDRTGVAYPTIRPAPGYLEQSPEEWWRAATRSVRTLVTRWPEAARNIQGVGLSGHMSSLVLLDEDGHPVRPAIILADARESDDAQAHALLRERMTPVTGFVPGPAFAVEKLLWLRQYEPETLARTRTVLFAKDYLRFRLVDRLATEPTDAANSLVFDTLENTWRDDVLAALGLPRAWWPELWRASQVAGEMTTLAARRTGLRPGIPVVYGGADMATSTLAMGGLRGDQLYITLGTAAQVVARARALVPDAFGRITFHPQVDGQGLYAMGSVLSGTGVVPWAAQVLGFGKGTLAMTHLLSAAEHAPPGAGEVVCLPYLVGRGTPAFRADARAEWSGLHSATTRADMARALVEGVAFSIMDAIEAVEEAVGPRDTCLLGGGGSRYGMWPQVLASVLNRPIRLVTEPDASALGASILAARGTGLVDDVVQMADRSLRLGTEYLPRPQERDVYRIAYTRYRAAAARWA